MAERFLVVDIGGTNTRIGRGGTRGIDPFSVQKFRNADHPDLNAILTVYLSRNPGPVSAVCAGVAGPVRDGTAQLTNRNWCIDAEELRAVTGAREVRLINDLQAQGYALDDLDVSCLTTLYPGVRPSHDATRLVMGLGTGCNIAVVHRYREGLTVPASETGHSTLPHMDERANDFIDHLAKTHPLKPIEAALSGPGLTRIHHYLSGATLSPVRIIERFRSGDAEARETLTRFTHILGVVAGNIVLAHLPMGGFYLIGGIARALAPYFDDLGFSMHFTANGPYAKITQNIPVILINDDFAALRGCTRYLLQSPLRPPI